MGSDQQPWLMARLQALGAEAAAELFRAMDKHAPMHSLHEGWAVIFEELDELWDEVRAWQPDSDMAKARKEAIQIAAMALRLVHDVCDQPQVSRGATSSVMREAMRELHPGADFS